MAALSSISGKSTIASGSKVTGKAVSPTAPLGGVLTVPNGTPNVTATNIPGVSIQTLPDGSKRFVQVKGYTPYETPTTAPAGSYDPQLDAQGQNTNLGYLYGTEDYGTSLQRALDDYTTSKQNLGTSHGYTLADLVTAGQRDKQDYDTKTGDLNTSYRRLGVSQGERASQAGVAEGGALVAAANARAGNQAHDQSGLDTGYQRQTTDLGTQTDRENAGYATQLGALGTNYDRTTQDLTTNQSRATGSNALYNTQLNQEKVFNASQNGLLPSAPANEHTTAGGKTFRTVVHNGVVYHETPSGQMIPIRPTTAALATAKAVGSAVGKGLR